MPTPTEVPKATGRSDPYRNFRFRLKWDGHYVAGFSKVSGLAPGTPAVRHREGGDPAPARRIPGQDEYAAIVLQRGVTHDVAFQQWASKVWDYPNPTANSGAGGATNQPVSVADFRKDVTLDVCDEAGGKIAAYNIYRCWVSEFTALPDLDASGNAVAIESLTLQNEGWERDAVS